MAGQELGLLMVLLFVCVLTFSSLIYFAEKESAARWSFPDSFWWVELADRNPWLMHIEQYLFPNYVSSAGGA